MKGQCKIFNFLLLKDLGSRILLWIFYLLYIPYLLRFGYSKHSSCIIICVFINQGNQNPRQTNPSTPPDKLVSKWPGDLHKLGTAEMSGSYYDGQFRTGHWSTGHRLRGAIISIWMSRISGPWETELVTLLYNGHIIIIQNWIPM